MKKKLALLMAAIMTVAMVPATAFASTKLTAVDEVTTGTDDIFTSRVELKKSNDQVDVTDVYKSDENGKADDDGTYKAFDVILKLTNGTFAKNEDIDDDYNDKYIMDSKNTLLIDTNNDDTGDTPVYETYYDASDDNDRNGILAIEVTSSTSATITLDADKFNEVTTDDICILPIVAKATETGDVTATFTSNVSGFKKASEVIATAVDGDADVAIDGVTTFVEDGDKVKEIKDITINGLSNGAVEKHDIKLKLKGNYEFSTKDKDAVEIGEPKVTLLNDTAKATATIDKTDMDEVTITFDKVPSDDMLAKITIDNVYLKATKDCDPGDVATITVSSDDFDSVKLEAAKMVEEAVTYSVEDKTLPTIWAGKNYAIDDDSNTLKLSVEENTGDILNTSRKATFTFPEGIEVVGIADDKGFKKDGSNAFKYEIDENVLTIYNYQKGDSESKKTDFSLKFILNAAPTFSGDVTVTLGGQFDDTSFKVATVKAPYTVEAKTSEVLIDYRYVPVNDIVITEAEDGILDEDDKIVLAVEKMNFEDAGDVEVKEGDIDVDVDIDDKGGVSLYDTKTDADYLVVTVKDESTVASTIVISGLELYLDRTLPVGGYALQNVGGTLKDHEDYNSKDKDKVLEDSKKFSENAINVLWENSVDDKDIYDYTPDEKEKSNGIFKYKEVTANDTYVDVITAARDSDDSMTTKKIVITVGATTMTAGTETVTLDAPAYINAENYTMLPLRAITEAFGATVNWDNATRTVTILKGQRVVSMTIGSKTMYVNGTPVAMNTAPEISADRTFVPVRDLANSLGISNVNWTEASGTVTLN